MNITIGLSYAPPSSPKYNKYVVALLHAAQKLEHELTVINLSEFPDTIESVDGILFTGGADVDPTYYNKPELLPLCSDRPIESRDTNEFTFATKADERNLPILGICRGIQLLNVHYGGTLIADLEHSGLPSHSKIGDNDRPHEVVIEPGTLLMKITRETEGGVASAHHQAIDAVAPGMQVSSRSVGDNVIEAIEWKEPEKKPYFLAVQWHPERMDLDSPLSAPIFENFVENVAMSKLLRGRM
jgi:putative glutamine amidotransferase